jgi:gag-polypeptide of LTR copia-type
MEPETNIKVKEFSGNSEDFHSWSRQFRNAMVIANLQEIIGNVAPVVPADEGPKAVLARKQARVYSYIMMNMDSKTAEFLENHSTEFNGYEAWTALKGRFTFADVFTIGKVRSQLENIELMEDDDLDTFINRVETLTAKIRSMEGPQALTDKTVIAYVLRGVSQEFPQWIYTQQAADALAPVLKDLRAMDSLRKVTKEKKGQKSEEAFTASANSPRNGQQQPLEPRKREPSRGNQTFTGTFSGSFVEAST